ncbi:MAG: TetR family transcriptional regulator [Rhodospirillaceae bacterium]|nr:MAG: TetR family transcriptional regulator [Rhodospirillaceae bacterium]
MKQTNAAKRLKPATKAKTKPRTGRRGRPSWSELQNRAETREFLMQAVHEAMVEDASADFSLSEIAKRTGLSSTLVQYHFGGKEGLMIAQLERASARAVEQLRELAEADLPAVIKLRLHIGGLVNAAYRAPYLNRLVHALTHGKDRASARRVSELLVRPIAAFQKKLLEQGQREGIFRPISPAQFYFIVTGACDHMFWRRTALADVFGIDVITEELKRDYARLITAMVLKGISSQVAPR